MGKIFKDIAGQITEFWNSKDKNFKRNLIIISAILVVSIATFTVLISNKEYAVLYTNLDLQDAGNILEMLDEMKVPSKAGENGTIMVPKDRVDGLRMDLATKGYPKNGFDLDIIKMGSGIGVTEEDKRVYRQYQLQQHIQNAIKTIEGVADARVLITLPVESSFVLSDDIRDATAAILLTKHADQELSSKNIRAIAEFVQKSVPGLTPDNISIIDSNMNILDFNANGDSSDFTDRYALQCSVEDRLEKQIMDLLQPIFGLGRAYSKVSVKLNFDERTIDSEKFEPSANGAEGIIVSIDRLREDIRKDSGSSAGSASNSGSGSVADTGPGTGTDSGSDSGAYSYPVMSADDSVYYKNAETINYEVNSIKEHIVEEKGYVESLSVSVIIDSTNRKGDYSESVKNLVAAAVGVSEDSVAVEYLPLAGNAIIDDVVKSQNETAERVKQAEQFGYYIRIGVILLIIIVGVFFMFRTFASKGKSKAKDKDGKADSRGITPAELAIEAIAANTAGNAIDNVIEMKENDKKEKIGELINSNPELVANILRSWLSEEKEPVE